MVRQWTNMVLALLMFTTMACDGPDSDGDGDGDMDSDADAEIDGDIKPDGDIDGPGPTRPGGFVQTSGGGRATTSSHRAQVRIGAPQPVGAGSTSSRQLRLGPGALR